MDSLRFDPLDTTGCEAEPIRYPGAVQPHGALLVVDPVTATIEAASESCQALIGLQAQELLDQSLASVMGPVATNALRLDDSDALQPLLPLTFKGKPFMARSQRNATGQCLIDIEPSLSALAAPEQFFYDIRSGLEALRRLDSSADVCRAAAQLIGKLTGLDRVMIYRFDDHWNGEVIAESNGPGFEPYLGLHFPASDIPKQARELFQVCRVRLISDVQYVPSALMARNDAQALDLGRSSLRSVSPLHIQYLKNMGARATLVCALVVNDRLWGLVSCQQKGEARYFTQAERDALGWLCQDVSALVEARLLSELSQRERSLAARRRTLIHAVRSLEFSELMRAHNNADLLGVVGADGFALIVDEAIQTTGTTPSLERIRELHQRRLTRDSGANPYASHALVQDLGPGADDAGVAGALFVTMMRQPVVTMIWFRRERRHTLAWGGDPTQPHLADENGRLTPRTSFAQYLQEIAGQSEEWLPEELQSAGELISLVEIEALRSSEAFSKTILNSMTEHISVLDEHGVIVTVNDAWKRFAAVSGAPELSQASVGMSYRDICTAANGKPSGDSALAAWTGIHAVLKRKIPTFSLDYPCDSRDQKRWFRLHVNPVQSPAGGAIVVHEDVTLRKQAELDLEQSESHFKAAQVIAALGSWESDLATGETKWSAEQYRIFGYAPGAIQPNLEVFSQAVHPDDFSKFKLAIDQMLIDGLPFNIECRIVRPDGAIRHVHCRGALERDEHGQALRMDGTVLDITDRVLAQHHLEELLAEQKALLENDLFGIMQAQNRIVIWCNPAFEKMLGYEPGELVGKDTRVSFPSDGAYHSFGVAAYSQLAQGKIYRGETEYVRKDGGHIWVDVRGSMLDATSRKSLWCFVNITARKLTSDRLRESESRFRTMADSAPVLIWIAGLDKLCFWFNKVWLDFTGRTMAQEMGNGWAEGVHPDDFERCLDTYVTAFDARREFSMEYRLRRHDGEYRWLIDNGVPRFDDAGVFAGYIGSCIDISDRKQAELALKESEQALRWNEERLRSMFSTMVEGVVFQHKDGTIMDANVAAEKMLKLSRDELLGRTSMDPVWSPIREDGSDFPGQEHPSMVTLRTGMPLRDQVMGLQRNSGETRWISINSQPLLLPGNPLPEAVVTSFTDITDRKAAETERRRLAKIIEDAPDFIAMSDMKSNLKYLNAAGAQMVGLEADFDLAVLQIKDMHPKWAAQRVLFEGIPAVLRHGVWESENALLNRDGHEVPVSQMLLLHRDEAGNPQYLSTIMRDISLLKTREKELDVSRVAAEQANVAKSRFLATMSHEIRTPMNGILGMAQLLLVAELSERSRRDYARTILSSGQTLLMLLNDILDLSKIEAGQLQLEQIVFDPAALLQETETLFSGAAQTKGLRLDCKWRGPAQGRYSADAYRIRQMVSNLVGNAVKFTAQGHIHIEGRELEHAADVVVLEFSVADTGMGIPPDKIDLLFKPFSQTDTATTREFGGTGLGLSIVSNLAKAMGGSVGVESTQGKGSRFWFRLRCRQVDASEESRSAERANPGDALDAKSQIRADGRALVVEDNAINCMVIESLLATMGVKVTIVNDGQQAVDAIRNGDHPNLIFMDLHMPVMDGYTATELIRQWELEHGTVRLPIIALTADAFAEDKQHCMDVGMDDFLTKPVEIETLRAALATWMPGRSSVLPGTSTGFRNGKPLEVRQFQALVAELKPLLMENIFDAYEQFMDLQALTAGTVVADEIDEMVPLMESLQFSLVVQRLDGLMERLSRSPS